MQATNILTSVDKQSGGQKSAKNATAVSSENSFNQLLSKEISNGNRSDNISNNNVSKAGSTSKANSTNTNNNNNSNNKVKTASDNSPAPKQPTESGTGNPVNNTPASKVEDSKPTAQDEDKDKDNGQEQDIGAQILALVGNLTAAPISPDTSKATKPDALTDTPTLTGLAATRLPDDQLARDATAMDPQTKFADTQISDTQNASASQPGLPVKDADGKSVVDDKSFRPNINAVAAQLIASKADTKSGATVTAKTVGDSLKVSNQGAETGLPIPDTNTSPLTTLAAVPKDITIPASKNSAAAPAEAKAADAKPSDSDLISKITEKAANTTPDTGATNNSKSFANDILQARDVLTEKMSATKLTETGKEIQIVANPPPAQVAINGVQPNAANTLAADHIGPRVGSPGWDKAIGQKVVWMVGEAMQSAELTLNPPDLGPLQVVLKLSNEQASASFTAAQPEVREALEAALPRLKQMLSDAGVQLTGFSVNSQAAGQNQSQGFEQQQARNFSAPRQTTEVTDNTINSTVSSTAKVQLKNGLVDTFA